MSERSEGCRSRRTGTGSPSLIEIGRGSTGSGGGGGGGGGDGTRGVDAFFFCDGVTASETRLLAAGSRPARSLRFSAMLTLPVHEREISLTAGMRMEMDR